MSREALVELIDNIDVRQYYLIYKILMKFVAEVAPTEDEIEAIEIGKMEYAKGDYISADDFNWEA